MREHSQTPSNASPDETRTTQDMVGLLGGMQGGLVPGHPQGLLLNNVLTDHHLQTSVKTLPFLMASPAQLLQHEWRKKELWVERQLPFITVDSSSQYEHTDPVRRISALFYMSVPSYSHLIPSSSGSFKHQFM
jgi:hypothetical protein